MLVTFFAQNLKQNIKNSPDVVSDMSVYRNEAGHSLSADSEIEAQPTNQACQESVRCLSSST